MIQVNDLLIVEVPEGSEDPQLGNGNGVMVFHDTKPIGTATRYQLPFPCEIIGLASEIDHNGYYAIEQAASMLYQHIVNQNSLTSPDKDYLFLKRKG